MTNTRSGQMPDKPRVITDKGELAEFCHRAARAPYVTVDTEFMRETTYWPILCLVQVGIGGELEEGEQEQEMSAVIDPLADGGLDLSSLFELMANEAVLKVFHAARQDLEIFHHLSGSLPKNVFDSQVAAMVCGFGDSVGYESLLQRLTGAQVDKGARFTDWSLRPLSDRQIEYALADVVYLMPAYEKLCVELQKRSRESWIGDEMSGLLNEDIYLANPRTRYLRIKSKNAKPRTLAVLRELAAWREIESKRRNQPRNRILRDETLLEIAHHTPDTVQALSRTRGLGNKMAEGSAGKAILDAIKVGKSIPADECPKPNSKPDLPNGIGPTTDLLKVLLKMKCEDFDVAQKLIASSDDVEQIAAFGEDALVRSMQGWRYEIFGQDALRLRNGKCAFTLINKKLAIIEV